MLKGKNAVFKRASELPQSMKFGIFSGKTGNFE